MLFRLTAPFITFVIVLAVHPPAWSSTYYKILSESRQDPTIFTQGFVLDDGGTVFLSSGLYGKSFLRSISDSGNNTRAIDPKLFAEGISLVGDSVFMLTWKAETLLEFDKSSLDLIGSHHYKGQGWGLTHDGTQFLMSNGSHYIQARDDITFAINKFIRVTQNGKPLNKINELEFAHGHLWANVWFDNHIYKIDPATGEVVDTWDLSELVSKQNLKDRRAVLNGIAYDKKENAFWVTGKLWPKRYLVRLESDSETNGK